MLLLFQFICFKKKKFFHDAATVMLFGVFYHLIRESNPIKRNGLYFPNFVYFGIFFPKIIEVFQNVKERVAFQSPK